MAENSGHSEREEFRGAKVQILGTNPEHPEKGRIFVWTKMGWFERLEGPSGNVAFTPIAESQEELKELILEDNPRADLRDLVGKYRKKVTEEFMEQSRSNPDEPEGSAEYSGRRPAGNSAIYPTQNTSEETDEDDEDQEYHQHDL
jgi:hypothetical protein